MTDTSDRAAYALLERIARKAVEPMDKDAGKDKTLGQCRDELLELLKEAVSFVMTRNATQHDADITEQSVYGIKD